ncbi:hypothetical protein ACG2K1_10675 [Neisseria sp. 23W00296]|uniref:hypothetical protein n=1 Tax=unclassified Neisseria TaxID=2623750 RepID=UPI0037578CB0
MLKKTKLYTEITYRDDRHRKSSLQAALADLVFYFLGSGSQRAGMRSGGLFLLLKKQAEYFAKGK